MAYLEELLPEFRKGAKIRCKDWKPALYIYIDNKGAVITEKGNSYVLDSVDFNNENWELYREPEPDWQYIIDHKCLCCFWDDISPNVKEIGFLENIFDDEDGKYYTSNGTTYKNCRPVRRDEVIFYEDKKDDQSFKIY